VRDLHFFDPPPLVLLQRRPGSLFGEAAQRMASFLTVVGSGA
jgi:hypothetical protein